MTSHDAKAAMLTHALYRLHAKAAITEYGGRGVEGIADVLMLTESDYIHEFEVKVDAGDLAGELAAIKYLNRPQLAIGEEAQKPERAMSKTFKHRRYLLGGEMRGDHFILPSRPNYFSFVVPEKLQKQALEALEGTPYGLYMVVWVENGGHPWHEIGCQKKAKRLHTDKAGGEVHTNILRKACTEIENLRGQIAKGRRCTSCHNALAKRCDNCEANLERRRQDRKDEKFCWAYVDTLPEDERGGAFGKCMNQRKAERVV